jgi:hypothetical protein
VTSGAIKTRQHIRPRKADATVCVLSGLSRKATETSAGVVETTSRVEVEVECGLCRVGADLMMEASDLLMVEGRWVLNECPAEYRSVYAFTEYLCDDERWTFTQAELQELVRLTNASYRETLEELKRLKFSLARPRVEPEVRGIGRLKRPTGAEG